MPLPLKISSRTPKNIAKNITEPRRWQKHRKKVDSQSPEKNLGNDFCKPQNILLPSHRSKAF
jgi:hypothetical protein